MLGVLWWSWAAYAWLTNTINPEEGIVRLAMFGAMGAMLIASLAVPNVFGDDAFFFACAYAVSGSLIWCSTRWRAAATATCSAPSRDGAGTAVSVALLFVAAALDGKVRSRSGRSRWPSTCWAPTSAAAGDGTSRPATLRSATR